MVPPQRRRCSKNTTPRCSWQTFSRNAEARAQHHRLHPPPAQGNNQTSAAPHLSSDMPLFSAAPLTCSSKSAPHPPNPLAFFPVHTLFPHPASSTIACLPHSSPPPLFLLLLLFLLHPPISFAVCDRSTYLEFLNPIECHLASVVLVQSTGLIGKQESEAMVGQLWL